MEAQAEKDLDFAYFRYWNLLETIAAERVERGTPVTDFHGQQILKADGTPFNTSGAQGHVYELAKRGMQARNYTEETFAAARELSVSLWNAVYVWYAFRNATAHHGGFNPDDPNQHSDAPLDSAPFEQPTSAQLLVGKSYQVLILPSSSSNEHVALYSKSSSRPIATLWPGLFISFYVC